MDLDEMLGIDPADPVARRARRLHEADEKLIAELVKRRRELGLSQDEVARRMDTGQSTVARIESGARDLHQSTLRRYAMAVEAVVEHRVVPDDPGQARSAAILRDLLPDLDDKFGWPAVDFPFNDIEQWGPPPKRGRLRAGRE